MEPIKSVAAALADPLAVTSLQLWNARDLAELPAELARCRNLETLAIHGAPLTALPAWLGELPLRSLELSFCEQLTELPALPALARLDLSYTPVRALPRSPSLRAVALTGLRLEAVPDELRDLPALEELDLEGNWIKEVPGWLLEKPLRALNLHGNDLGAIPAALLALPTLEVLDLSRCGGGLTAIPDGIADTRLRSLKLTQHPLTAISEALCTLASLEVLELASNRITVLPDAIDQLHQLRVLDLSTTLIAELPAGLGRLSRLEKLSLGDCPLRDIAAIGELTALRELELGTTFSPSTAGYHDGYARRDRLALPPMAKLTSLETISAGSAGLVALPEDIGACQQLRFARFDHNQITSLPDGLFALPALRSLWLQENTVDAASYARLEAWGKERRLGTYDGGPLRMPFVATVEPSTVTYSATRLAPAVVAELTRLGVTVDSPTEVPAAKTAQIRDRRLPVPEALRQLLDDLRWPSVTLRGAYRGWDLELDACRADLSEYECTHLHPLVPFATHAIQSFLAVDLSDPTPADPTVWYVDHDATGPDATAWGPLSRLLAALARP